MRKSVWQSAAAAIAISLSALAPAHAGLVTFDDIAPSAFGGGETFVSGGFNFQMTSGVFQAPLNFPEQGGFGTVDTAASLSSFNNAPVGNATQFFAGLNDNAVTLTGTTPVISLAGFDFAFIPPVTVPNASTSYLLAVGWLDDTGAFGYQFHDFGLSNSNGDWAFLSADTSAPDFGPAMPTYVTAVSFLACDRQGNDCIWPFSNQGQFALDNLRADLPLPGTWWLAGLGLAGLAVTRRRHAGAAAR